MATRLNSFVLQIINIIIIGGATGALGAISATIIGDTNNTARWFGIKFSFECLAGVILLFVLPITLIPDLGFSGVVFGMVIIILIFSPVLLYLSHQRPPDTDEVLPDNVTNKIVSKLIVWFMLFTLVFYFIGASAIWAFLERLANNNNFDPSSIGVMLGATLFFAVIGAIITGVVGNRFGNLKPFLIYSVIFVGGAWLILTSDHFILFSIGAYA